MSAPQVVDDECNCEFDAYEHHEGEVIDELDLSSWHHKRTCGGCGTVWWSLHCPHDGIQHPCPACGWRLPGTRGPLEALFGVRDPEPPRPPGHTGASFFRVAP